MGSKNMTKPNTASKNDLKKGVLLSKLPTGKMLSGKVDGEEVLLVHKGNKFFAVGAHCTHYGGALAEGLIVGETVRCPLHHACFSLRTGDALRAPALDPIPCWNVEKVGGKIFVREKLTTDPKPAPPPKSSQKAPESVVIIGGGAAGLAAADMLRREGYSGAVTIISADDSPPCDRPNLSKDFLAGTAQEEWIPLRPPEYYTDKKIELLLNSRVSALDIKMNQVHLKDGRTFKFGTLLIATGADPVHLKIDGATDSQINYLRTFADSRAIIEKAAKAKRVVVVGASFIGLEVAASLRKRKIEVHVVAPDSQPLGHVLGPELGGVVQKLHESQGVVFHLGRTVKRVDGSKITLDDGKTLNADFVVLGVGVRPSIALAEQAGLTMDRGIVVNEYLETSAPGIFAAGDVARWPDPHSGERIRVEHWVVAERQGQVAAKNILGQRKPFDAVPFFWSQHYDIAIHYVGHAEKWDSIKVDGSLAKLNCAVSYKKGRKTLAVATISRDLQSLQSEATMEKVMSKAGGYVTGKRKIAQKPNKNTCQVPKWINSL
jgi:NADPH-dependent 2,4-dienoyl-CoA reductase/sulfur reductase-like enzyme/nitrite reductase/ring-hydroxylating ferredoxin subunit